MIESGFAKNLTGQNLSSHLGPVRGKGDVRVGFFWTKVQLRTKNPAMNGKIVNRLCIAKQPIGDRYTVSHAYISQQDAARLYPQEFGIFTQYETAPSNGTPLSDIPGVSRSEIGLLELHAITCVEDLLSLHPDQVSQIGMSASRVYKVAKGWQDKKDENEEIVTAADVQAKAEEAIKAMEDRLARLEANNNRLQAENDVLRHSASGHPAQSAAVTTAVQAAAATVDDAPYEFPDDDGFMAGGDVVTGNDDLSDMPDPMKD
ncbi:MULTISPECIES: bZIP transcription factor [unclassified Mameliella]|uniref:bZIP transcription factor n=1 Tax=unclassified Mameliella TaxID=2630630 RepID=UPI00273FFFE8|nr:MULTISPECIES: bZIP transcription factor [unclassified Mameliella]